MGAGVLLLVRTVTVDLLELSDAGKLMCMELVRLFGFQTLLDLTG